MPFAQHDGCRLYWRRDGLTDRPALLLLNSIGTTMALWDRVVPFLLRWFQVIRMDTRGHGASDAPAGDYSLPMLAADARAVLDAAGVERAAVCGISLGGMIAARLALDAPDRVSALVLACTSAAMDVALWRQRLETIRAQGLAAIAEGAMERFFSERFRAQHPELVAGTRAALLEQSADGYCGCGAAIRDMVLLPELPRIAAPTLVVAGRLDVSTPFAGHGEHIVAAIPGARAALLDTAHLPSLEDPAALAAAIHDFLAPAPEAGEPRKMLFDAGLKRRREVLGDPWVDRSLANRTGFNADFQAMITRIAWQEIWTRPGLDDQTRRLLVLAITAALGRWEEFRLHVRAGLERGGFTVFTLKETLMQAAIYAGVPAANTAFSEAASVMRELGIDPGEPG